MTGQDFPRTTPEELARVAAAMRREADYLDGQAAELLAEPNLAATLGFTVLAAGVHLIEASLPSRLLDDHRSAAARQIIGDALVEAQEMGDA